MLRDSNRYHEQVMLHCGSTLALSSKMPSLNVKELSACTPAVWTKCRKQLKAKLEEKKSSATLAWLPQELQKVKSEL